MMWKRARSRDRRSFGTTETPGALRSPPGASGEPRRLLIVYAVPESSGECRLRWDPTTRRMIHHEDAQGRVR